jgi:DNA-binding transcriptional regulator YiaG
MEWNAEKIAALRKRYHLTRKALGELVGVTISTIYQWERRLKKPSKTAQLLLSRIEDELKEKEEEEKHGHKRNL